jgi:hypothetical protein
MLIGTLLELRLEAVCVRRDMGGLAFELFS